MIKKLAIGTIAATAVAVSISLPQVHAQATTTVSRPVNPQGTLKPEPFADVPPDHWAYNAVEYLRQAGLTEGYPDRTYKGKRPMTRYEFAQVIARMVQGLEARIQAGTREVPAAGVPSHTHPYVTQQQLDALRRELQQQQLTRQQVQQMIDQALRGQQPPTGFATVQQLQALQNLVNEFRNELARLGVDVDAARRQIADLRGRVEAIEAELARRPVVSGVANLIGKSGASSDQVISPVTGAFRPVFDRDGVQLPATTQILENVNGYYDVDLGITARPASNVRVGVALNAGNYLSSYAFPQLHNYLGEGPDDVRLFKAFVNVPFRFLGSNDITIGRQGVQLSRYTFKAIDPDSYTMVPREDSGDVYLWGVNTTWRFGDARLGWFAGIDPVDGRLQALNLFSPLSGVQGLTTTFGAPGAGRGATAPITTIGNLFGARLSIGDRELPPAPVVGTREIAAEVATPPATAPAATAPAATAPAAVADADTTLTFGPLRNIGLGFNYLIAGKAGSVPAAAEDARAQVMSVDSNFRIGPVRIEGEAAWGQSQTGGIARPRALDNSAFDIRGFWGFGLGSIGDLEIGGGWRRIELGYVTPGFWDQFGSWKNPRGIRGPLAEIRLPFRRDFASFFRDVELHASGAWYQGAQNLTLGGLDTADERDLRIDRYLAGVRFGLTSRNTVDLGWEQVYRNFAGAGTLALPTMGVGGSALTGSRIRNTESYINLGVGHSFTPDVALKLLYQLVDFQRYAVDTSNQPANYRGYVATAQVGVRF